MIHPGDHVLLHYPRSARWPFEGEVGFVQMTCIGPTPSRDVTVILSDNRRLTVPPEFCVPLGNPQSSISTPQSAEAQP